MESVANDSVVVSKDDFKTEKLWFDFLKALGYTWSSEVKLKECILVKEVNVCFTGGERRVS